MAMPRSPWMAFNESLGGKPEALADPNTPPDVKAKIRADMNYSLETVAEVGARNRGKWATRYELRDRVMADYVPGKRHEPKRLARQHNISRRQIEKWIAQLRATAGKSASRAPTDWRDVYHGEALRHHYSVLGRRPKKPKG
jgi:hypothetical protein